MSAGETKLRANEFAVRFWSGAGLALAFASLAGVIFSGEASFTTRGEDQRKVVEAVSSELAKLKDQQTVFRRELTALSSDPNATASSSEVATLREEFSQIVARQSRLEMAISRDPAKALELPLIRRDLDNLRDGQAQAIASIQKGVDQVYDLNKWLLGGMAISIISIAISNFLQRRKPEQ